jgi:hypothetical protein
LLAPVRPLADQLAFLEHAGEMIGDFAHGGDQARSSRAAPGDEIIVRLPAAIVAVLYAGVRLRLREDCLAQVGAKRS